MKNFLLACAVGLAIGGGYMIIMYPPPMANPVVPGIKPGETISKAKRTVRIYVVTTPMIQR